MSPYSPKEAPLTRRSRRNYWAEIADDKITFYTSDYLEKLGILSELNEKRSKYWCYMRIVRLPDTKVKVLKNYGIKVLTSQFFAINGRWHWFTGYSPMDAFRLTSVAAQILSGQGLLTVNFRHERPLLDDLSTRVISPSEFKAAPLLERIKRKFEGTVFHIREYPEKGANYVSRSLPLTNEIIESLKRQGIKLYKHQADAIEYALKGRNVVIATPTASGKTVCFNTPVLDAIIRDAKSCALYIYPTKALAQDQIRKIARFRDNYEGDSITDEQYSSGYYFTMKIGGKEIAFGKYEGPTPQEIRRIIRERCSIILTNPDELHFGILRFNQLWTRFLKNSKYVVLDEIHVYRGIFGSHMALIIRRLRKVCEALGARPVFILCSATIGNPIEHAKNLTGCDDFVLIDKDGSPKKKRFLVLWNPPLKEDGRRVEALTNLIDLLTEELITLKQIVKTIAFGRSRLSVKLAYKLLEDRYKQRGIANFASFVREYTATLPPKKREEIFAALASGKIHGIIGTNALELGVDISDMSCYLSIGYPGSITSVQQQFGRVGRVGEGLGIVILHDDPLEQYFSRNPEEFFDKKPEDIKINPKNPELLRMHLACCIHEMTAYGGISEDDIKTIFGEEAIECLRKLAREQKILQYEDRSRVYWKFNYSSNDFSQEYLPIRNPLSNVNFTIICDGKNIGVMDSVSVLRDLHPGAIWIDNDKQYEVEKVDFENKTVNVREVDFEYYTVAVPKDKVHILQQKQQKMLRKARAYCGLIGVRREVKEYWKIVPGGEARLEKIRWDISIPEDICTFNTEAFWLVLPNHYKAINKAELESALHAIEHALLTVIPKWINCDPNDIKGAYTTECPESGGSPTIFIFDNYPGGIGLARSCFQRIHDMLRDCIRLIETCKCKEETGCPSCIQTSRCERQNKNLNKKLALKILKEVTPNSL